MRREIDNEDYAVRRVKRAGGFTYKLTVPGRKHVPDRIVILPAIGMFFAEVKLDGKKLEPGQKREHDRIREWGGHVEVWKSKYDVDEFFINYENHRPNIGGYWH
jgi:hypothetical protein